MNFDDFDCGMEINEIAGTDREEYDAFLEAVDDTPDLDEEDVEWGVDDGTFDDSMDGDHDSAMASAGWGTDEDYGHFGPDDWDGEF